MLRTGLIAKKIGNSSYFSDNGSSTNVTILKIDECIVSGIRTGDKNGYSAVKLGFINLKSSKLTNQMKGFFAKRNTEPKKIIKEFRLEKTDDYKTGNEIGIETLKDVKFVDVRSQTIGKGFAGVMKRYNFAGLRASHGVSVSHRSHGSTGQNQDPGKVFKGKKMAGHMGAKNRTMLNLEIIKSDLENSLLYLKGSIPGSKNSVVLLRKSVKTFNRKTSAEKYAKNTSPSEQKEKKPADKKPVEKKPVKQEQPKKK